MAIGHLLERGVRRLSTGEMRRVLIARALLRSPWLLILDEPFGGLDPASRQDLHATVGRLVKGGTQVILVTHHADEIFEACSHVICLKEGRVLARGRREDLLTPERMRALYARRAGRRAARPAPEPPSTPAGAPRTPILVEMKNVTVAYGTRIVLDRVDWTVRRGENWAVQGPNGSGKSTLLRLITGDHPQAYANDIRLFGRPRGSGETVWEIKGRIGMVSPEFQIRFHRRMTVMDMVLSGFFDSVGLYRRASAQQRAAARRWVEHLGLAGLAGAAADRISYGERRMALIARAMVKSPEILVLDEPCQGLDRGNREMVIDMVNQVGTRTATCLVYVTHRPEEIPACIAHVLVLGAWEPPVVGESPATPSRSRPIPGSPSITENAG